jgi:hypothetical protein
MVLLAIVLPVILAAGLMARRPVPTVGSLSGESGEPVLAATGPRVVTDLEDGTLVAMQLLEGAEGKVLGVSVEGQPGRPEWLAYWAPEADSAGGRMPEGALLLGALEEHRENRFDLPEQAVMAAGRLILYRPISSEVLASLPLPLPDGEETP